MGRREFVGGSLLLAAGLKAGRALAAPAGAKAPELPDLVDAQGTDPKALVAAALAPLGGIARFVKKGQRVAIKPNASFANPPDWGTTTHPDTVAALAQACLDAGAKEVVVFDYTLAPPERCLARCGLGAALASLPVKVKTLSDDDEWRRVEIRDGKALQAVEVSALVLDADVFINVPNAKAHRGGVVSMGLKNLMGVVRDRRVFHREGLHESVADLARVVRPHLTVLDATRVLTTNGPGGPGETAKPGRMIAGTDPVAVDCLGLGVARFDGKDLKVGDVPHLALAAAAGLGVADTTKLRIARVKA